MKKMVLSMGILMLVATSCSNTETKLNEDSLRIANLTSELSQANDYRDSLLILMDDIYQGIDQINQQEGMLLSMTGVSDDENRRVAIRENLESIRQKLQSNRELLAKMEKRIKEADGDNAVLAKTIENLKGQIASQETKIAQLNEELESARATIEDLNVQVAETQEQVRVETEGRERAEQEVVAVNNELNRCYYAIGTNKELKNNGLISKKFLGSTKVLEGSFDASYFTRSDRRTLRSIPCNNKNVKIWTNHPEGSYEIIENPDRTKTIRITNADKFWSLSNHLIIQIG